MTHKIIENSNVALKQPPTKFSNQKKNWHKPTVSSNFTANKGLQFFCQFIDLSWLQASMVFDKFNVVSACLPEITNFSLFIYRFFCFFATKQNSLRRKFHFNENKNCCLKFHAKIHVNSSTKLTLYVCFHQKSHVTEILPWFHMMKNIQKISM